jgi:RNA polymerase sigma factor (sigma-70 family)
MDRQGFEDFAAHSMPALGRYAFVLTGNTHDAQDLVQDALLKVYRAWARVDREGNPLAYTKQTMVHLHISALRRLSKRLTTSGSRETAVEDVRLSRVEDADALRQTLMTLSPLQRAVLVMSYLDDLDDATIGDLLHREKTSIRSLRQRGLASFRIRLKEGSHGKQ